MGRENENDKRMERVFFKEMGRKKRDRREEIEEGTSTKKI
jgi:hypothetical protein